MTLEVLPAPQPPKIVTSEAPSLVTEAEQSNDCIVDQVNGEVQIYFIFISFTQFTIISKTCFVMW